MNDPRSRNQSIANLQHRWSEEDIKILKAMYATTAEFWEISDATDGRHSAAAISKKGRALKLPRRPKRAPKHRAVRGPLMSLVDEQMLRCLWRQDLAAPIIAAKMGGHWSPRAIRHHASRLSLDERRAVLWKKYSAEDNALIAEMYVAGSTPREIGEALEPKRSAQAISKKIEALDIVLRKDDLPKGRPNAVDPYREIEPWPEGIHFEDNPRADKCGRIGKRLGGVSAPEAKGASSIVVV